MARDTTPVTTSDALTVWITTLPGLTTATLAAVTGTSPDVIRTLVFAYNRRASSPYQVRSFTSHTDATWRSFSGRYPHRRIAAPLWFPSIRTAPIPWIFHDWAALFLRTHRAFTSSPTSMVRAITRDRLLSYLQRSPRRSIWIDVRPSPSVAIPLIWFPFESHLRHMLATWTDVLATVLADPTVTVCRGVWCVAQPISLADSTITAWMREIAPVLSGWRSFYPLTSLGWDVMTWLPVRDWLPSEHDPRIPEQFGTVVQSVSILGDPSSFLVDTP